MTSTSLPDFPPLRCPSTGETLEPLSPSAVELVREVVRDGAMDVPSGSGFHGSWSGAFANVSRSRIYPVIDGIPVLLEKEALRPDAAVSARIL